MVVKHDTWCLETDSSFILRHTRFSVAIYTPNDDEICSAILRKTRLEPAHGCHGGQLGKLLVRAVECLKRCRRSLQGWLNVSQDLLELSR